jgi:hypothetical protein
MLEVSVENIIRYCHECGIEDYKEVLCASTFGYKGLIQ